MFFKVIDDVIGERYSKYIFESMANIKWTFLPDISYGQTEGRNKPGLSFTYFLENSIQTSEYELIKPMILESFDKFQLNLSLDSVYRCRCRLTIDRPEMPKEDLIDAPHVDYNFKHLVLLYYANNTDGNTIFFDSNQKIVETISPKRGRCILFDGSILHASSTPTLSPRVIINTNIKMNV